MDLVRGDEYRAMEGNLTGLALRRWGVAQFGDALIREAGWVAQLVEQRTENPCVGGSIPPPATTSQLHPTESRLNFAAEAVLSTG